MMRVAIFALLAIAATVSAELGEETMSQLGLEPSNDQEKAHLSGNMLLFEDFCIQSRDYVANDIKNNANDFSARVFSLFFDSAETMGRDTLAVAKLGSDRLAAQLANPSADIAEATNEVEQLYAQGQEKIKAVQTQPLALLEAFKTQVGAISSTVKSQITAGLNQLKAMANVEQLVATMQQGCDSVAKYEIDIKAQFEDFKAQIADKSPVVADIKFTDVPCVTARKVSQAEGLCRLVRLAQAPLKKLYQTRN